MSMPLIEALEQVELDPGSIYRCRVKGHWVEVRVHEEEPGGLAKPLMASDERLDPWFELPGPAPVRHCEARPAQLPFDPPSIPAE